MTVFVCGISRTGKTSLIKRRNSFELGFSYVSASEVLRSLGLPVLNLSIQDALSNQRAICNSIERQIPNKLIVDGHLLIETNEGPFLVPVTHLLGWNIRLIVFVSDSVNLISERRGITGKRFALDEIGLLSEIEFSYAKYVALKIGAKFEMLSSQDTEAFHQLIESEY